MSLKWCAVLLLMLTVKRTYGTETEASSNHRVKRLTDVVCNGGTTRIIPPNYYHDNSPDWCMSAVGLLNNDFGNLAYRQECQRWLGGPLPDKVAQAQLVYCYEYPNTTVIYRMGVCCHGVPAVLRCFSGDVWVSSYGSNNYVMNYENELVTCQAGEVCQNQYTFYGWHGHHYNKSMTKGCVQAADCAAVNDPDTGTCKSCEVETPSCTTCCDTPFCNYDYNHAYDYDWNWPRAAVCPNPAHPCSDYSPCQNGAVCWNLDWVDEDIGYTNYTCWCTIFYGGRNCTESRELCEFDNPCLNGGTCYDRSDVAPGEFRCLCQEPFVGEICETQNNLTCSASDSNYRTFKYLDGGNINCTSLAWYARGYPERWIGGRQLIQQLCGDNERTAPYRIEFELMSCTRGNGPYEWSNYHSCCFNRTLCATNPCLNGGTCYDYSDVAPGEFRCECPEPYIGDICELQNTLTCASPSQFHVMRPYYNWGYYNPAAQCSDWAVATNGHPELVSFDSYGYNVVNQDCRNAITSPVDGHHFVQGVDGQIKPDRFQFQATYCGRNTHLTFARHHTCCPTCLSSPCQNNGYCQQLTYTQFICKCTYGYNGQYCENKLSICVLTGDPHIRTFDGITFDYQGTCEQTLSAPCNTSVDPYFQVIVKTNNRSGIHPNISFPTHVEIHYKTDVIRLFTHPTLISFPSVPVYALWNNGPYSIPFHPHGVHPEWRVWIDGLIVRFEALFGLSVAFDGNNTVFVNVPTTLYPGEMCGLCGNNDDEPTNDLTLPDGTYVGLLANYGNVFGDSNVVAQPIQAGCSGTIPPPFGGWSVAPFGRKRKRRDVDPMACNYDLSACQLMNSTSGEFAFCVSKIGIETATFFAGSCVMDACFTGAKSICSSVKTFVDLCTFIGAQIPCHVWQDATKCSGEAYCPPGMLYKCSTTACLATCADPEAPDFCPFANKDSCVCPRGELYFNGTCMSSCPAGCLDPNGQLRLPGEMWAGPGCTSVVCELSENSTDTTQTMPADGCPPGMVCVDGAECVWEVPNECDYPGRSDDERGDKDKEERKCDRKTTRKPAATVRTTEPKKKKVPTATLR